MTTSPPKLESLVESFSDFFYAAPMGLKVLDAEGRILFVNGALQQTMGYSEEQLRNTVEYDLIHPADQYRFERRFAALVGGELEYSEIDIRHKTNSGEWVWTSVTHMPLGSGAPDGYFLERVVDISRKKHLADQVVRLQSSQTLGRLVRGIAHDFRNVLQLIELDAALLENEVGDNSKAMSLIGEIGDFVDSGTDLAEQLTHFGSDQEEQVERIDASTKIQEMATFMRRILPKGVELELDLAADSEPSPPPVMANPSQFDQIVMNLAVNARDAVAKEGEVICIRTYGREVTNGEDFETRRRIEPGHYLVVEVSDDGIGMDEETRQKIFEPFFTTKAEIGGSGMGLAVVYGIVREGRGYVELETNPGEGSCFRIFLPAADEPEKADARDADQQQPDSQSIGAAE